MEHQHLSRSNGSYYRSVNRTCQDSCKCENGLCYARSAEFLQLPAMHTLKWLRVIGNTIFAAGTVALAWFIFGLKGGWSINNKKSKLNI